MIIIPPPKTCRAAVRWSRIRALGSNRAVRSSYLWIAVVPIAARIVHSLKANVTGPGWTKEVVDSLHLPFSWQVLFWAAISMAVATLLFDLACPKIIKRHNDHGSFSRAGETMSHLIEYVEEVFKKRSDPRAQSSEYDMTIIYGAPRTSVRYGLSDVNGPELEETGIFWRAFAVAETSRILLLRLTLGFYVIGLSLVGWVLLANIRWVLSASTFG